LKLIIKEIILPKKVNSILFIIAPFLTFFTALIS
jgi:NADH:ubiquinone oxidoreductase subunit H